VKTSEREKIKLEASFFNGLGISTYFLFTTGFAYAGFTGDIAVSNWFFPVMMLCLGYAGGWYLHYRGKKVLERLDSDKT
jgi:threonine/homoserine/homoserine lactone efflux protein